MRRTTESTTLNRPDRVPIETPSLGDRSYVVHDGEVAFVVDPQRDIDRVLALLDEHGVRLTHVFETHIHNDYVTGGLALAAATGAAYVVNGADDVSFDRTPSPTARARGRRRGCASPRWPPPATPSPISPTRCGRRDRHRTSASSPAARCSSAPPAGPTCSVTSTPTPWSATSTPRRTGWPTCCPTTPRSSPPTASARSAPPPSPTRPPRPSVARERSNPVLTQDEETYVRELLDGLGAWPAYYAHMAPANAAGPAAPDLSARQRGRRRRAAPPHRGRRVGRRPAQPHRLRGRPRPRHPQLRPRRRLRDLPRLADPLGHPGHPARRDRRRRRRGPARAGPHRHRPPGGPRHRDARATGPTASSRASRPRPSPTSPRSGTTARW